MPTITRKEAWNALAGFLILLLLFIFIKNIPDDIFLKYSWIHMLVGYTKEFSLALLPEIGSVLIASFFVYHFIINRRKKHDIFLSVPMTSLPNDKLYREHKTLVTNVFERITSEIKLTVYNPTIGKSRKELMDLPQVSLEKDLAALDRSRYYVMILSESKNSSVIFEAGFAFCHRIPSLYFVKDREHLPYIIREAEKSALVQVMMYTNEDEIVAQLRAYPFKF